MPKKKRWRIERKMLDEPIKKNDKMYHDDVSQNVIRIQLNSDEGADQNVMKSL